MDAQLYDNALCVNYVAPRPYIPGADRPDDPRLLAIYISIRPGVEETRTREMLWTPSRPGRTEIRVEAVDARGRAVKLRQKITVVASGGR